MHGGIAVELNNKRKWIGRISFCSWTTDHEYEYKKPSTNHYSSTKTTPLLDFIYTLIGENHERSSCQVAFTTPQRWKVQRRECFTTWSILSNDSPQKLMVGYKSFFFSQCVSGRNSTNPAIWLVPGAGGIFPSGPLSAGEIIKSVSSLSGNLLNDLCYYVNKNLSVKPLSSTWITSVFITICSLEIVEFVANLAMITALKCWGLSHAFRCVVEKNKSVIHQPRSVRIGKNCVLCLEYPRPRAQFFPILTSRTVDNIYLWNWTTDIRCPAF